MNVLFVHNNFPAQYKFIARALANHPSFTVTAIGAQTANPIGGVKLLKYAVNGNGSKAHPFARRFDAECLRAEQVLYTLTSLKSTGFIPDAIFAHPGWGETLPLRTFFPAARLIAYCEFYYGSTGRDVGFDPEFPEIGLDGHVRLQLMNASTLLALSECDLGVSPTEWQRSTYPDRFRSMIDVIHEGVDVETVKPNPAASFRLPSGRELTAADEVVTFAARNLEPLRGYHIFMRALPKIMAARPHAEIIIIGADGPGYGASPPTGSTWRKLYFEEAAGSIDSRRVHFVGPVPYAEFLSALQISTAHVYLTYPFVASWSLLEAMSAGCVVIGSDTGPVREFIDGETGMLVPFFDVERLADAVIEVLSDRRRFAPMRQRARQHILDRYDVQRHCLPRAMALLRN